MTIPDELTQAVHTYRSKPATVRAAKVTVENAEYVAQWCGGAVNRTNSGLVVGVIVPTINGDAHASVSHFVVEGVVDFYPCDPDTFESRWEADGDFPPDAVRVHPDPAVGDPA